MLSGMMSMRSLLCSGEAYREAIVGGTIPVGQSGSGGSISSHCFFGQVSSRSPNSSTALVCIKVSPMCVAYYSGSLVGSSVGSLVRNSIRSSLGLEGGRGVSKCMYLGSGVLNFKAGGQMVNVGFRASSSTSLSRLAKSLSSKKNSSGRLHCSAEARLSDLSSPAVEDVVSRSSTSTSFSSPPPVSEGGLPVNLVAGVGITAAVFMMAVLGFLAKPSTNGGSVADLIKRGQLRSDRGADVKTLMYEDPFNNPLVKMGNKNPIVKMCGKMFRLAPVTLTEEKVLQHQNRRIQAYKWRRPNLFLNEGEPVPEGVDPEEVRWIPSNHPFATTSNSIDEELAQKNVYQTRGVPSRVRAEHEALRKRIMEAARGEPEFEPPKMENSGAEAWKTSNETSETSRTSSGDEGQGNGNAGGNSPRNVGVQGGTRNAASESRFRTIDFSGEEQGLR